MNKKIDDIFKEKFSNFEAKPETDLWSKIQNNEQWTQHLRRQSVKNIIIYAVLGIIAISTSIILINNRIKKDVKVIDEVIEVQDNSSDTEVILENVPTVLPAEDVILEEPETIVEDHTTTEPTPTISTEEIQMVQAPTTVTEMAKESTTPTTSPTSPTQPKAKENKENSSSKIVEKPVNTEKANTSSNTTPPSPKPTASPFSIPNAFTPNGDGLNDVFVPVTNIELQSYQLDIYARNGQKLFTSRDLNYGWNGEYQGAMMDGGSYIYFIKYEDSNGQEHIDKGQLLLIR